MAGRGNKKISKNDIENKKWLLGAYSRRSFDDGETSESYTITNQKQMLKSFIESQDNIKIEEYYDDDGYTGTNFNRPEFKRLMQDVVCGRINGIIVKDLSRLGRNHKEVGKYIEEIFPIYNLRIIAINDNVDSFLNPESINSLIIPVKNLMNENYSRDISVKVASAYKTMAKSGQFVAGTTPYGYMLDPNDKHHLIPDEKEAKIVKKVFEMALEGNGRIKICKYLNDNGILCRKELQRRTKRKISLDAFEVESTYLWSTSTISRMLTNESYIGNLVQLKTTRVSFGNEKIITKAPEDCVRSNNTHEAIISKDDFNKVQIIKKNNDKRHGKSYEPSNWSIFRGVLKCKDCGRAMLKQEDTRRKNLISNYYCMGYLHLGKKCSPHKIKTKDLETIVLEAIQLQVKLVIELEKSLTKLYFHSNQESFENEYKNNIKIAELRIANLKEEKRKHYEDWKFEKIEKKEFIKLSDEIEDKINQYNQDIELYTSTYKETVRKIRKNDYWIGHYKRNRKIKRLSVDVIKELIECIFVLDDGNVEIKFKYQDEYKNLIKYLESEGVKNNEKMDNRIVSEAFI